MMKLLISMVATALVGALPSAVASPSQGGHELIAFERWVGDGSPDAEVWVMELDGSHQRKLADGCCFAWSPDGRKLAFYSENAIHTINTDGTNLRTVTLGSSADWSPDGQRIVVDGGDGLDVVSADGERTQLTRGSDRNPRWSPNGRWIVFERSLARGKDIFVVSTDGSGERRLTRGLGNELPAWSPGGRKIAYLAFSGGDYRVVVMNADGSSPLVLPNTAPSGEERPAWSPTGSRILYARWRGPIHAIRPDGRGHRILARGRNEAPGWSSDGRRVVFRRESKNQWDLHVMTASGKNVTNLTNTPRPLFEDVPAWSPAS